MQFCAFSCFYTEDVSLRCVPVSIAGSDSEISPCSHPASFCVGLNLLALPVANIFFYYCFLGISSLKEEGAEGESSFYHICCSGIKFINGRM